MVARVPSPPYQQNQQAAGITSAFGIAGGAGLSAGGALTASVTISLTASGVTAASYGTATSVAQVTFNALGQATTATSVPISYPAPLTANVGLTASSQFVVAGSPVVGGGTFSVALQTSSVAPGTYGNATAVAQIAVNAQGQVTSASGVSITFPTQSIVVSDEGTASATIQVMNFAGAGVTMAATGATALVTIGAGGSDPWTYTVLGVTATTTSVVAQPTNLFFVPAANTRYEFEAGLMTRTSDVTVGPLPGFQWSAGLSDGVIYIQQSSGAGTTVLQNGNPGTAIVSAPVGGLPTNNQSWPAFMWGFIQAGAGASGTCRITFASEVATSRTVAIQAFSYLKWRTY